MLTFEKAGSALLLILQTNSHLESFDMHKKTHYIAFYSNY